MSSALAARNEMLRTDGAAGLPPVTKSATRTLADIVEETGFVRSRTRILAEDVEDLHQNADQLHVEVFQALIDKVTAQRVKDGLSGLIEALAALGFSWRNISRVAGVSLPAVQKWRRGGQATPQRVWRLGQAVALCDVLAGKSFLIRDAASWLEMPVAPGASVTGIDLLVANRLDLVLRLAAHSDADPETLLREIGTSRPGNEDTEFEVVTAPDGLPAIKFRDPARRLRHGSAPKDA